MEKKLNTPLEIDEIDFRIQSINKGGYATILAYKDARADMKRLDEIYGAEYWQKKYDIINGNLFCSVGVFNKDLAQWVWKQDVGTESNTEKEKGQASDAFKRACFCLGIGRELYDYPVIQVKLNQNEYKVESSNGKDYVKQTYDLRLKEWSWVSEFKDGKLVFLTAFDNTGKERFRFEAGKKAQKAGLPKMTEKQFGQAKSRILNGEAEIDFVHKIEQALTLSKEQKDELVKLIANAPQNVQ